ncbi:MAG: hypothetical protein J6S63_01405 [Atopobiaceae bacterium]|nr:hypothetical protein [Atopobiaceae bacterium]
MMEKDRYNGRSKAECERYGKPNIGAQYDRRFVDDVHHYKRQQGVRCVVCGAMATDTHHWPPIGKSYQGLWTMRTKRGWFVLKPSLFALCRFCHDKFHHQALTADWVWDTPQSEEDYWNGELSWQLKYMPHSKGLYELGHWEFKDPRYARGFTYKEVRGENGVWKAVRGEVRKEPPRPARSLDED